MMKIPELFEKLSQGDRTALAQAITLVESRSHSHRAQSAELLDLCVQHGGNTFRFCVSGAPGVGKSTLIERLGKKITTSGETLAVLAIDPTSQLTQGSILGDKTRMPELSRNPDVFIRPSAAGQSLGGVADRTREVILLCEAAGYGVVCLETVGVGQSEVAAGAMTDFFLMLVLPGGGDELQGMKRGIVEMADLIAVTRADGDSVKLAQTTRRHYLQALHFYGPKAHGQKVDVLACSAVEDKGIEEIWNTMRAFRTATEESGYHTRHRAQQDLDWLDARLGQLSREIILSSRNVEEQYRSLRETVRRRETSISAALVKMEQMIRHKFSNGP